MKTILSIFTIAVVMAACNTNHDNSSDVSKLQAYKDSVRLSADTAGLAQYQTWKAQNAVTGNNYSTPATAPVAAVKNTVAYIPVHKATRSSSTKQSRAKSYEGGSMNSESSNTAKAPVVRKQGWSKAAKGAAIGAGTGAVIGAVISKNNRASGAIIGGVLGGGAGYGIGRTMDKKDGRY